MKERPILFSGPMIRSLLDGTKTQTRRIVTQQPSAGVRRSPFVPSGLEDGHGREIRARYGRPGDLLWVREAWQAFFDDEVPADRPRGPRHTMGIPARPDRKSFVFYKADGPGPMHPDGYAPRWKSPMHMPRWASRITLEITGVRVERLQDISEADAIAEGMKPCWTARALPGESLPPPPQSQFSDLWESLNGPGSWAANPWVWVIAFRRIKP